MPTSEQILERKFYVEAFLQRWECENTRRSYRMDIEILQTWCSLHNLDVFQLHRIHLEVFKRYLADERKNTATTILHRFSTIAQFYDLAVEDGLSAKNPTKLLKLPKRPVEDGTSKALTVRQFERLVHVAAESSPRDYALVLTMGMCGLRVTPALSLDVETATVIDRAYRLFVFRTKGGETQRVPQPPAVMQAVDMAIDGRKTGPLFLSQLGGRLTRSGSLKLMKRLGEAAEIPIEMNNHTLRHTFAVTSLEDGASLEETALSLGHKDSSTTFRYYGRKVIANNHHTSHRVAAAIQLPDLRRAA